MDDGIKKEAEEINNLNKEIIKELDSVDDIGGEIVEL
jgi:hypothetical protein